MVMNNTLKHWWAYDTNGTGMLRQIWQVALADGKVEKREEQFIHRIADLIGVSADFIKLAP